MNKYLFKLHQVVLYVFVFLLGSLAPLYAQTKAEVLTNASVIKLSKAGLDPEIIITKIETSACKFDLTEAGLINLKSAGLSSAIMKAMMAKTDALQSPVVTNKTRTMTTALEPEKLNTIYLLAKPEGLKQLEKSNATQKLRKPGLVYGTTLYTCEIAGEKSPVRINQSQPVTFVINTGGAPVNNIVLFKTDVRKKSRSAVTSKVTGTGSMKGAQGIIPCAVKMRSNGVYEIVPETKLDAGEYLFTTKEIDYTSMGNMEVFAFGID